MATAVEKELKQISVALEGINTELKYIKLGQDDLKEELSKRPSVPEMENEITKRIKEQHCICKREQNAKDMVKWASAIALSLGAITTAIIAMIKG